MYQTTRFQMFICLMEQEHLANNLLRHFLIVENNHNENGYSASTKGCEKLAVLYRDIPPYSQGDIVTITFAVPSSMLTLPSGGGAELVSSVGSLFYAPTCVVAKVSRIWD